MIEILGVKLSLEAIAFIAAFVTSEVIAASPPKDRDWETDTKEQ